MTLNQYIKTLQGKSVTVIGAGISNRPWIRLLCDNNIQVTVRDKAAQLPEELMNLPLKAVHGDNYLEGLDGDVIFRTPGLHPYHPALKKAQSNGSIVTSEMELFLSLCPCRVLAVTGSDGKTTTTTLISELLKAEGYTVHLGGNIGRPLLCDADSMQSKDYVVLELSSFQLHSMQCSPDVAVITNLAPNHLDVHPDYADYVLAKKQIFAHQKPDARLVLNADNPDTFALVSEALSQVRLFSRKIAVVDGTCMNPEGDLCLAKDGVLYPIVSGDAIKIPGLHNRENFLAAFAATEGLVSIETMQKVAMEFNGVSHRLEKFREWHGVSFINDSIASSPSRTMAGLSCFDKKLRLLAGGKGKGLSMTALGDAICEHVKSLYLCGPTGKEIEVAVRSSSAYQPGSPEIQIFDDFAEMVNTAAYDAEEGDIVLLSPASTSFDRFRNFEERGDTFKSLINKLE